VSAIMDNRVWRTGLERLQE